MKIDTHIHSQYSGHAGLSVKEIILHSKRHGVVPSLTDHDAVKGWISFEKEAKKAGIPFIKGEEVHIFENGKCIGELLGLFLEEEVRPGEFGDVVDAFKKQGALVSAAHPFDSFRKALFCRAAEPKKLLKKIDAIEAWNSRSWTRGANERAGSFAEKNNSPFTAGTDAHFPVELGNAFLEVEADSLEEARKKILKGKASFWGKMSPRRIHLMTQLAKLGFFK